MDILVENLNTPGFIDNFIFSNIDQLNFALIGICSYLCMICFFGRNNHLNKKRIVLFFLPTIFSIILMCIEACFIRFNVEFSTWDYIESYIFGYASILFNFILVFSFYKEKRMRRMLEAVLVFFVICSWSSLSITAVLIMMENLSNLFWRGQISILNMVLEYQIFYIKLYFVVFSMLVLLLYFCFYKKRLYIRLRMLNFLGIMILWMLIEVAVSKACSDLNIRNLHGVIRFFGGLLLGLITVCMPIVLLLINHRKILAEKNKAQEDYLESELKYIEQYKVSQEKTKRFQLDILNQLFFMQCLMKEDKNYEVKQQLEALLGQISALSPKYVTGDEMLDCIVAMKAEKMEAHGIDFSMDGIIDGGLSMKPLEVCTIFANVLDNAIEAVSKIEEDRSKWIAMSMKKTERFWVINISNATNEKPDVESIYKGEGYTSKKDSEFHGIGIRNIKKTVEKKEGIMKLNGDEDSFSLTLMLPRAS